MSYMFEVYYKPPADPKRETDLARSVARFDGRLSYREADERGSSSLCLTFEFANLERAEAAAVFLRGQGEYVEGPVEYAS